MHTTGPAGPVSIWAGVLLVAGAPLLRGGNRPAALIALELLALVVLGGLVVQASRAPLAFPRTARGWALLLVLASPLWLALVHLTPLPQAWWLQLPGRAAYAQSVRALGLELPAWLPASVAPADTLVSLLAALPLCALFLLARNAGLRQLRWLAWAVVAVAALQVVLGLLQLGGGMKSPLYFGAPTDRPIGTFANSNHFANALLLALVLYAWLALVDLGRSSGGRWRVAHVFTAPPARIAAWVSGALLLLVGLLASRSRGTMLAGVLLAVVGALGVVVLARRQGHGARKPLVLLLGTALVAVAVVGGDLVVSRLGGRDIVESAGFRGQLAATSLEGARAFFPWGSGWGTYAQAYQRFQPAQVAGEVGHAHQDYVEMLFEGGVFALVLMALVAWLLVARWIELARHVRARKRLDAGTLAVALCGFGLLAFLLHSLVEFNMHIPANAIIASLMAGVFLRPSLVADDA